VAIPEASVKLAETEIELLGAIVANVLSAATTGGVVSIGTVKFVALVPVSPATVTVIAPVVEPVGTDVVILVAVLAVTVAVVPLKFTVLLAGVVLKFAPVIVTDVPTGPLPGVNEVRMGTWASMTKERRQKLVHVKTLLMILVCQSQIRWHGKRRIRRRRLGSSCQGNHRPDHRKRYYFYQRGNFMLDSKWGGENGLLSIHQPQLIARPGFLPGWNSPLIAALVG